MHPSVHNPSNFEPADYLVVDYLDNRSPEYCGEPIEFYRETVAQWEAEMRGTLGEDWRRKAHRCVHCGNGNVRWITAVRHAPTSEIVVFGSDCTERLGFANKIAFKLAQLQARAEAGRARMKAWKARESFVAATPGLAELIANAGDPVHAKNFFLRDVIAKLNRYGSLSPRQVECLFESAKKDLARAEREKAEANEIKGDAPTGRVAVTGEVLCLKEIESDFGFALKMLLKLTNNSKVWLTAPASGGVEVGKTITVRATFTRKADDPSFAFGSRPVLV